MFSGIVVSYQRLLPYHAILGQEHGKSSARVVAKAWSISVWSEFSVKLKHISKHIRFELRAILLILPYHSRHFRLRLLASNRSILVWWLFIQNIYHQSLRKSEHILPSMRGKRWFRAVLSDLRIFPNHARIKPGWGLCSTPLPSPLPSPSCLEVNPNPDPTPHSNPIPKREGRYTARNRAKSSRTMG